MAVLKVEHLGIAVNDASGANELFAKLLGRAPYKHERVDTEGVSTSFFAVGDTKVELLQALKEGSPIAKFIQKRGEGIHHVALAVDDLQAELDRLTAEGFEVLQPAIRKGADHKLVSFLHPKTTHGVLVELCQDIPLSNTVGEG